jgi:hypothetical protein
MIVPELLLGQRAQAELVEKVVAQEQLLPRIVLPEDSLPRSMYSVP